MFHATTTFASRRSHAAPPEGLPPAGAESPTHGYSRPPFPPVSGGNPRTTQDPAMHRMHGSDSSAAAAGRACLSKKEAQRRKTQVGRVDYALDLLLPEKSAAYSGEVTVDFDLVGEAAGLFLDFQGRRVVSAAVNGKAAPLAVLGHRIALPAALLGKGRNVVSIRFENDFDKDGSGLHKATDPADGLEYVFSDCEPFNANRFFPCFDQPDLKATFSTTVTAPAGWVVVSNGVESAAEDVDAASGENGTPA